MKNKKVAVAISGGVDSGVAAALLVKKGYQCAGFHLHLWKEQQTTKNKQQRFENKCCNTESLEAARKTARQLGIDFHILDYSKIFKKQVVNYFLKAYASGLTPNPCVACNKFIKFGELLSYVRKLGFDYLATGHYARIMEDFGNAFFAHEDVRFKNSSARLKKTSKFAQKDCLHLLMGVDRHKDQSYFLYNLNQKQLSHILFPLGEYTKKKVIMMAKKWQLPVAHRPESQEICFLPENDYRFFLKRYISSKIIPGEVVNIKGQVIGRHFGLPLYTVGQRHGFEIKSKIKSQKSKLIPPYYVIGKDVVKNQLVVGFGKETEKKEFLVRDVNWLIPQNKVEIECQVRVRHQGILLRCRVKNLGDMAKVVLNEPERGIAPGQSAVFYYGEKVLGGGVIHLDNF